MMVGVAMGVYKILKSKSMDGIKIEKIR